MQRRLKMKAVSKYTKLTMLLIAMTTTMSNVAIVTALPHFSNTFSSIQNIEILSRMMITMPSLAIAFLAPFLGHLIFKIGRQKSALIGLFIFALAGTAGLYLDTVYTLLASRFLLGISIAILMIVSTSLIGDYFKAESRNKFMAMQGAFVSIGGVFFVVGGGVLSDINWRYTFVVYAIGFILIPFVLKFLKENSHTIIEENEDAHINSNLYVIYLLALILMMVFYILPTQIPFLIMNHFGSSGTLTGAIIACAFAFNAAGAVSFPKLKRKFSFVQIYLIGMAIVAFGFIAIGNITNVYYFFLSSSILGFGGGVLMTNMTAWMLSRTPVNERIQSSGYLTASLFLGQFFSSIVWVPILNRFTIDEFFIIIGLIIAFSVIVTTFMLRYKGKVNA
jgi:MFS family permease